MPFPCATPTRDFSGDEVPYKEWTFIKINILPEVTLLLFSWVKVHFYPRVYLFIDNYIYSVRVGNNYCDELKKYLVSKSDVCRD